MPTFYYSPSCKTCMRTLATVESLREDWRLRDIKEEPLTEAEVDALAEAAGSYGALFSRRAQLYRKRGLHELELTEGDYRRLLLEHYTFMSRPVIATDDGQVFIGSSKQAVAGAVKAL